MRISRLEPGEKAPDNSDRVHINRLPNGKSGWSGAVTLEGGTLSAVSSTVNRPAEEAEAEAIDWAEHNGVTELIVETDAS